VPEDRELYLRCPACEGGDSCPACEDCGGVGFVPAGLTTEMLARFAGQVEELHVIAGSIDRIVRANEDRRRSRRRNNRS
jgi:hypothetical protein